MWGFSHMNKYAKLEVLWHDAVRTDNWGYKPSVEEKVMRCKTMGYFFKEDDHSRTIVSTYGDRRDDYLNNIIIPKGSIIKINKLNGSTQT